jgi:hypothetical protein
MKIQIDDIVRDATPEEEALLLVRQQESQAQQEALEAKLAAKESAKAKLAALGLTEDEVNALIGGI